MITLGVSLFLLLFLLGHASSALNVCPQERLFIAVAPSVKQPILQKDFYWAMHQVRPLNVWPQERLFIAVVPSVKQPVLQKDAQNSPMIHPYYLLGVRPQPLFFFFLVP